MMSSTAAPVRNVLGRDSHAKGMPNEWCGSSAARKEMALQGGRHTGC